MYPIFITYSNKTLYFNNALLKSNHIQFSNIKYLQTLIDLQDYLNNNITNLTIETPYMKIISYCSLIDIINYTSTDIEIELSSKFLTNIF